jgi:hypothetical protein
MELAEISTSTPAGFVENVVSYGKAGIFGRVIRAAQEVIIRVILPPEVLGAWSLIVVLISFASISELGVFSAARRELPILYARNEYQEAAEYRSMTFNMQFIAKLLMALGVIFFCLIKNGFESSYVQACFAAGLLIVLASFGENFSCFFETAQKYTKLSRALSLYWPVYAILMVLGAYCFGVGGLVAANALALIYQGWLMRKAMFEKVKSHYFYWDNAKAKVLLGFAVPFFITDLPIN